MNYPRPHLQTLLIAVISVITCGAIAQDATSLPYLNPRLSPEERAADLVHRMTVTS